MMGKLSDAAVKVLSLGIGLAVGIVLIAKICFELSFDTVFADADRIYRICAGFSQQGGEDESASTVSGAVAPGFRTDIPGVEEATRTTSFFDTPRYKDAEGRVIVTDGGMVFADSCFFRVFGRPVLAGDPAKALGKVRTAAISRSFAEKLGGVEASIGQMICHEDMESLLLTVEAVYEDFPKNSSFDYDLLVSMETYSRASTENWVGNDRYRGYVKLAPGTDPRSLTDAIRKMQETHQPLAEIEAMGTRLWYYLEPFDKMHTSDPTVRTTVILLSVVAFLLLAVSLLNYILIVVSAMVRRSREMGVRKCYGAGNGDIHALLFREAAVHLCLALLLAGLLIFAGRGVIGNLFDVSFTTLLVPQSLAVIALTLLFILLLSVAVPAGLYQRVPVYVALKNYTDRSRRWKIALLGVQVLINVFLVVMMLVVGGQYRLVMNDDPGYDCDNLLYLPMYGSGEQRLRAAEALRQFPEVLGVEAVYRLPMYSSNGDNILDEEGRELFNVADNYEATEGFYSLLGIGFVEGRAPRGPEECAVDEAFVRKINDFFDWSDGAEGKTIRITGHDRQEFTVSGVYRDILTGNRLWSDLRPGVRFYGSLQDSLSYLPNLLVKVRETDPELTEKLKTTVEAALDGRTVELKSYAASLRAAYDDSRKMRNMVFWGAVFSLLIALLGLLCFIRNESQRRSKETAIRKINGAGIRDIYAIFLRDILLLSVAMSAGACAAAYFVAAGWLEQFAVKLPLSPFLFLGGTAFVLAVVLCAVLLNCRRIATADPVDSLKNE